MVGFMKGLGCGCCDICPQGYETGFYSDDFTTRDAWWDRYDQDAGSQTVWDASVLWQSGKLRIERAVDTPGNVHQSDYTARRKVSLPYDLTSTPLNTVMFDMSVDVSLNRPIQGYSGGPWYGYGQGNGGGLAFHDIGSLRLASTRVVSYAMSWNSGYTPSGFGEGPGPFETIVLYILPNIDYLQSPVTWTNHSSYTFLERPGVGFFLVLFDGSFSASKYIDNSITSTLRVEYSHTSTQSIRKFYYNGVHVLTGKNGVQSFFDPCVCTTNLYATSVPLYSFWQANTTRIFRADFDNYSQLLYT